MEEEIILYLQEKGWSFQKADNGVYSTRYKGKNTSLIVHLDIVDLNKSIVLAIAYLPIKVMACQLDRVAILLNEINLKTYFGSFEMDYGIGEVAFRTSVFYFNTSFQLAIVVNCLNATVYSADTYYSEIQKVLD